MLIIRSGDALVPERIRRIICFCLGTMASLLLISGTMASPLLISGDEASPLLVCDIKPWAIRFLWIKVTVSYYQRFRITLMQFTKQPFQRTLLCLRSGVTRSLAVTGKTSYICNTNRMSVMILAMRTDLRLRSTPFNSAVGRNNIMISTTLPAQRAVVAVNVRHSQCAASAVSAAMHNNQSYRSHKSTNEQFFIACVAANNSKFNIQHSKFKIAPRPRPPHP